MDFNKDKSVSAKEMQRWIMEKTEEHFQEAVRENKMSFHAVDPDGDGKREYTIICVLFIRHQIEENGLQQGGITLGLGDILNKNV